MSFSFKLQHICKQTGARAGVLSTPHGDILTPVFMPVGTQATVKALSPAELEQINAQIILSNTYHLYLRPGHRLIEAAGGLHKFMGWNRPILTDSGGFQVFSLSALRKISDEGVVFNSHTDGSRHMFTPALAMEIQQALGSDIIMAFDECSEYGADRDRATKAMRRTLMWLEECKKHHTSKASVLFPIVQGNMYDDLRLLSLQETLPFADCGIAIGGLSVGEPKEMMYHILEVMRPHLPDDKARYLMGVGSPDCLIEGVMRGIDMFDCVLQTRIARNGTALTRRGKLTIRNAAFKDDFTPIEEGCDCYCCRTFSKAYLRHLLNVNEILGGRMISVHNLHYSIKLMADIRAAILSDSLLDLYNALRPSY